MLPASAKETRLGWVPCTGDNRKRGSSRVRRTPSLKQRQVVGRGYIGGSLGLTYFFFAALGLLLGPRNVLGQEEEYVDGGDVSMTCSEELCSCSGSSADGTEIKLFDYPTSGDRIVSVDGSYSDILQTSCDTAVVAAGDTLYTLSDVELPEREFDVVKMSSADCAIVDIAKPADCYSGETSSTLNGEVELDMTICFCKHVKEDNEIIYKSKVVYNYSGSDDVEIQNDELDICSEFDFISQMATFDVEGESHYFNFELDIPDEDTSSLSVDPAPPSSAGAVLCEVEPTPSPEETTPPTEQPTPSVKTTAPATLVPIPEPPTPGPTLEPDTPKPSSAADTPLETSAPVSPPVENITPSPSVESTPGPTPTITVLDSSSSSTPVASTVFPTGAPMRATAPTTAPAATGSGAPNSSNTTAPPNSGGSLSPAPSGVTTAPTSASMIADGQSLDFEDRPLSVEGGNGVALAALGVLSVLTFLPACVK